MYVFVYMYVYLIARLNRFLQASVHQMTSRANLVLSSATRCLSPQRTGIPWGPQAPPLRVTINRSV